MTLSAARKALVEKVAELPSLPGSRGARLGVHIHQELVNGKRKRSAPYVVNVFDRSPAWITPRYCATFSGPCGYATLAALTWIGARLAALESMADKVNAATVGVYPYRADVSTYKDGTAG